MLGYTDPQGIPYVTIATAERAMAAVEFHSAHALRSSHAISSAITALLPMAALTRRPPARDNGTKEQSPVASIATPHHDSDDLSPDDVLEWLVVYTTLLGDVTFHLWNHVRQLVHSCKRLCALSALCRKMLLHYKPSQHGSDPRLLLLLADLAVVGVGPQNLLYDFREHLQHESVKYGRSRRSSLNNPHSSETPTLQKTQPPRFDCVSCSAASWLAGRASSLLEESHRVVERILWGLEKYAADAKTPDNGHNDESSWVKVDLDASSNGRNSTREKAQHADEQLAKVLECAASSLTEGVHDLTRVGGKEDGDLLHSLVKPRWGGGEHPHPIALFPATHPADGGPQTTHLMVLGGGYNHPSKCRRTCARAVIEERIAMLYNVLCRKSPSEIGSCVRGPCDETMRARQWVQENESLPPLEHPVEHVASSPDGSPNALNATTVGFATENYTAVESPTSPEGRSPVEDGTALRETAQQRKAMALRPLREFLASQQNGDFSGSDGGMWVGGRGTDGIVEDVSNNVTRLWNRVLSRVQLRGQAGQGCVNLVAQVLKSATAVLALRIQKANSDADETASKATLRGTNPVDFIRHMEASIEEIQPEQVPPCAHQAEDTDAFNHFMVSLDCALLDRVLSNHQSVLVGLKRELLLPSPSWANDSSPTFSTTPSSLKTNTVNAITDVIDALRDSAQTNLQLSTSLINVHRTLYTVCAYALLRCFRTVEADAWIEAIPAELRPPSAQLIREYCTLVRSPQTESDVVDVLERIDKASGLKAEKDQLGGGSDPFGHAIGALQLIEQVLKTYLAQATSAEVATLAAVEVASHSRSPTGRSHGLTYPTDSDWEMQRAALASVSGRLVRAITNGGVATLEVLLAEGYPTSAPTAPADGQQPSPQLSIVTLRHALHTIANYAQQFSLSDHHWLALEHDTLLMRLREPGPSSHHPSPSSSPDPNRSPRTRPRAASTNSNKPRNQGILSSFLGMFRGSSPEANADARSLASLRCLDGSDEEDMARCCVFEPSPDDIASRAVFPFGGALIKQPQQRVCRKLSVAPSLLLFAPEYTFKSNATDSSGVVASSAESEEQEGTSPSDEIDGAFAALLSPIERAAIQASVLRGLNVEATTSASSRSLANVNWTRLPEIFGFIRKWSESASEIAFGDVDEHPATLPAAHPLDLRSKRWFEALQHGGNGSPNNALGSTFTLLSDTIGGSIIHSPTRPGATMGQQAIAAVGGLQLLPPGFVRSPVGRWVDEDISSIHDMVSAAPSGTPLVSIVRLVAGANSFSCLHVRRLDSVLVSGIVTDVALGVEATEATMWRFAEVLWDRSRLERTQFLVTQYGKQCPVAECENAYTPLSQCSGGASARDFPSTLTDTETAEDTSNQVASASFVGVPYTPKVVLTGNSTIMGADAATASAMKAFYTAKTECTNYRRPTPLTFDQRLIVMRQFLQSAFLTKSPDTILSSAQRRMIQRHLPLHLQSQDWRNVYSTNHHGVSMTQLLNNASTENASLLVLKVRHTGGGSAASTGSGECITQPFIIGAFIGSKARLDSKSYHGSGATFVFRFVPEQVAAPTHHHHYHRHRHHRRHGTAGEEDGFESQTHTHDDSETTIEDDSHIEVFPWSRTNTYFINCRQDMFALGGPSPAIYVDGSLTEGSSGKCDTFASPSLLRLQSEAEKASNTPGAAAKSANRAGATDGFEILALELCGFGW